MQTSVKLENMEKHFNDILSLVDASDTIKRYLTYHSNNPLKVSASQPNILKSLIDDNILLSFFDKNIVTEPKCYLFFNLLSSDLNNDTIGEETYVFDIIIPTNLWRLKGIGQFRATRISMALISMLDQQRVTGLGEVKAKNFRCYKLNDSYHGATLTISVKTSNMKVQR